MVSQLTYQNEVHHKDNASFSINQILFKDFLFFPHTPISYTYTLLI